MAPLGHNANSSRFGMSVVGVMTSQTHPTDDRRQRGLHLLNGPGILVANPQPCLMKDIVAVAQRPEHRVSGAPTGALDPPSRGLP